MFELTGDEWKELDMNDWELDIAATPHYQRQFLAPENSRYEGGSATSYVHLQRWTRKGDPQDLDVEAELSISDGRNTVNFDLSHNNQENGDLHLAVITRLMEQVIAFRQAYADALATMRGQAVSGGADGGVVLTVNGDSSAFESSSKLPGVPLG